jgi:large-conductance mechanosensitive channel
MYRGVPMREAFFDVTDRFSQVVFREYDSLIDKEKREMEMEIFLLLTEIFTYNILLTHIIAYLLILSFIYSFIHCNNSLQLTNCHAKRCKVKPFNNMSILLI